MTHVLVQAHTVLFDKSNEDRKKKFKIRNNKKQNVCMPNPFLQFHIFDFITANII